MIRTKLLFAVHLMVLSHCFGLFCNADDIIKKKETAPYKSNDKTQMQCLGASNKPRFSVTDISWPTKNGEAEICLWKDDKYAAVSITIDDNCASDHTWWLEQCKKHDFRATWFIITKDIQEKSKGIAGSWEGWRKLQAAGHSVQSHTITHHVDISLLGEAVARQEYGGSQFTIAQNMMSENSKNNKSKYRCLTVGYPYGKSQPAIAQEYFIACRGTIGSPNEANRINYADTHTGGLSEDSLHAILGEKAVNIKWMNNPRYQRGWISPVFHWVSHGKTPQERVASRKKVAKQIAYMAKRRDRLWIDTFVDIVKYGQERDSATLKTVTSNANQIALSLTDTMRDDLFDYPLTVKVKVPASWKKIVATQAEKKVQAVLVPHNGAFYALVEMKPDAGDLILHPEN